MFGWNMNTNTNTTPPAEAQAEFHSHTVLLGRKRDLDEVSNDNHQQLDSVVLTPHKRAKVETADSGDGNPSGSFVDYYAVEPVSPDCYNDTGDDAINRGKQDGATHALTKQLGTAPSINWNTGSKAKIRISLGRGPEKASSALARPETSKTEIASHNQPLGEQVPHNTVGMSEQFSQTRSPTQNVGTQVDSCAGEKAVVNLPNPLSALEKARTSSNSTSVAQNEHIRSESPLETLPRTQDPLQGLESSDDFIVLNVQSSGQESGEISEDSVQGFDADRGFKRTSNEYRSGEAGNNSDSEGEDAMMSYSQSAPLTKNPINGESPPHDSSVQTLRPRILADLAPNELKLQSRYFHPTKTLDDLDSNDMVKCLVCAQEGHLPDTCDKLTCAVCGSNDHFTRTCPQRTRCKRCREPGHELSSCHHKLAATRAEIVCDWCQRVGHIEDDCELLWRTSGRPWETQFIIRTLGLGCYECGESGHLGNDCPTRMPGKRMGTSTWSLPGKPNQTRNSSEGMMIKGRAQQREFEILDSEDDDKANFFRPRIPAPARRGEIRTASQGLGQHRSSSGQPLSAPYHDEYQDDRPRGYRDTEYFEDRRGGYLSGREQAQYHYRSSDRRSASPPQPARVFNGKFSRYKPAPQERPPRHGTYGGESYRPMPSAAHNAWVRHRT